MDPFYARFAITDPLWIAVLGGICAIIVYYGRVEVAIGAFNSIMFWSYNVDVGTMNLLWVIVATVIAAGITCYIRQRLGLSRSRAKLLVRQDRFYVFWVAMWVLWMVLIYIINPQTDYATIVLKGIILYNMTSFAVVLLFLTDVRKVRTMAYAFIVTSVITGLVSLQTWSPTTLLEDNVLRGFTGANYLTFAIPFVISVLFALVCILGSKSVFEKIIMGLAAAFCAYCLIYTGARQSILGLLLAVLMIIIWLFKEKRVSRWFAMVVLLAMAGMGWMVYAATEFGEVLSSRIEGINPAYTARSEFWSLSWKVFQDSPILGNGLDYLGNGATAHNLVLDVMASQGLIGLVLFLGFMVFTLRAVRGTWGGVGGVEAATWRMGLLSVLAYTVVQTAISGGVGSPHLFWASALIWRLGMVVREDNSVLILPRMRSVGQRPIERTG